MLSYLFQRMRCMDYWIGLPLVKLLGWVTERTRCLHGDCEFQRLPERVICSKFLGSGSVVLCIPLLRALRENGVKVAFWTFEDQAEVIRIAGLVDELYVIRPTLRDFLSTLWSSLKSAKKFRADAFLDLEYGGNFSAALGRLSGAKARIGYISGSPSRERLYTHLVSMSADQHQVMSNYSLGHRIGLPKGFQPALPLSPDLSDIRSLLPEQLSRRRIIIGVHSNDGDSVRSWTQENWIELCNQLLDDIHTDLIFTGTEDQRDSIQLLVARLKDPTRVFNLAGTISLIELLRLIYDSDLVVGIETGLLHLASWVGIPIVGLFGPESPGFQGPPSSNVKVLWEGLSCSPCINRSRRMTSCLDNQCMKRISPDRVFRACMVMSSKPKVPVFKELSVA